MMPSAWVKCNVMQDVVECMIKRGSAPSGRHSLMDYEFCTLEPRWWIMDIFTVDTLRSWLASRFIYYQFSILDLYWIWKNEWWMTSSPMGWHCFWLKAYISNASTKALQVFWMMNDDAAWIWKNEWWMVIWAHHLVDTFNSDWQECFLESSSVKSTLPWINTYQCITILSTHQW